MGDKPKTCDKCRYKIWYEAGPPAIVCAVTGWDNIGAVLGISGRKASRYREELINLNLIFYVRVARGKSNTTTVAAFPMDLMAWARVKGKKGQVI
jgi:hypothetical protein